MSMTDEQSAQHAGLQDFLSYPFAECIQDRRTRRVAQGVSLQAGESSVSPMGRIDLTGTYPGGEGAVLNVQKFSNGSWQDFYSISATVTNGTFSTYIQTGTPGLNRFRVIDSDTHLASNEVRVQIR